MNSIGPARRVRFVAPALCFLALSVTVTLAEEPTPVEQASARSKYVCELPDQDVEVTAYVDLTFTVTTEGTVRDPVVIGTEVCEREDTEKTRSELEKSAIKAVLRFKYKPRIVDGEAMEVAGVSTRISYVLEDGDDEQEGESGQPEQ